MKWCSWICSALVPAVVTLLSCSSDGNNSTAGPFPFNGPSCSSGCGTCVQGSCSSDEWCLANQCADYFRCTCACEPADTACRSACEAHDTPECQGCRYGCFDDKCAACTAAGVEGGSSGADGGGAPPNVDGSSANGVFPFIGPSCPAACGQCIQDNCAGVSQCYVTDCSDLLTCACACAPDDVNCAVNCSSMATQACAMCLSMADACKTQHCGDCAGDAGNFDSGAPLGSDAGPCDQLTACCLSLSDPNVANTCAQTALLGDPVGCQQSLADLQEGGACP
jgi:hypothetical protein